MLWQTTFYAQPAAAISTTPIAKGIRWVLSSAKRGQNSLGRDVIVAVDETGEKLAAVTLAKASSEEVEKFKPSVFLKRFEFVRKYGPEAIRQNRLKYKIYNFPLEAYVFFMTIGALNITQLIFDNSANPISLEQSIDEKRDPGTDFVDPISDIGFLTFSVTNGQITNLFQSMRPELAQKWAPYLGMGAGMLANQIVNEVSHIPYMRECVADAALFRKQKKTSYDAKDLSNCDKFYKNIGNTDLTQKVDEFIPSLISTFAATYITGLIPGVLNSKTVVNVGNKLYKLSESVLETSSVIIKPLANTAAGSAVKTAGAAVGDFVKTSTLTTLQGLGYDDVAVTALRTSAYGRVIGSMVMIAQFMGLSDYLSPRLAFAYDNIAANTWLDTKIGVDKRADEIMLGLISDKRNGYQQPSNLAQQISEFSQHMQAWRLANMKALTESYGDWDQAISQLMKMYNASKDFYTYFLDEVFEHTYHAKQDRDQLLTRSYSLNGVVPTDIPVDEDSTLEKTIAEWQISQPQALESAQKAKVAITQAMFEKIYNQGKNTDFKNWTADEAQNFLQISNLLKSDDVLKMAGGLNLLNASLKPSLTRTASYELLLQNLRTGLGDPNPITEPGLGFVYNLMLHPKHIKSYSDFDSALLKTTQRAQSRFTDGPLDILRNNAGNLGAYILASMTEGRDPENNQELIVKSEGFKDIFFPPKIYNQSFVNQNGESEKAWELVDGRTDTHMIPRSLYRHYFEVPFTTQLLQDMGLYNVFNTQIRYTGAKGNYKTERVFDYLADGNNVKAGVLSVVDENGILQKNFMPWWEKNVQPEYVSAWGEYQTEYIKIIKQLKQKMDGEPSSFGDYFSKEISNKLFNRKNTEDYALNTTNAANSTFGSLEQETKIYLMILGDIMKSATGIPGKKIDYKMTPLLELVRNNKSLDFSDVLSERKDQPNLDWQDQIVAAISGIEDVIRATPVECADKGCGEKDFEKNDQDGRLIKTPMPVIRKKQIDALTSYLMDHLNSLKIEFQLNNKEDNDYLAKTCTDIFKNAQASPTEKAMAARKKDLLEKPKFKPTDEQKAVAAAAIQGLNSVIDNLALYAKQINAITYEYRYAPETDDHRIKTPSEASQATDE